MIRKNVSLRYEVFLSAAILTANATSSMVTFHLKEVKFFIALFVNWTAITSNLTLSDIQHVQISRYLEALINNGFLKRKNRKGAPSYQLTRQGVIELVERISNFERHAHNTDFFFSFYFLSGYGKIIDQLSSNVEESGHKNKESGVSLSSLLKVNNLKNAYLKHLNKKVMLLEKRVKDGMQSMKKIRSLTTGAKKRNAREVIEEVSKTFPDFGIQFSHDKPLAEILADLSDEQSLWELEHGTSYRNTILWKPIINNLKTHIKEVENLVEVPNGDQLRR
jgi:predicted transcriptional regulator